VADGSTERPGFDARLIVTAPSWLLSDYIAVGLAANLL
jgi:hypothetical protein